MTEKPKAQIDRFKEAAKQAETNDREETFDRTLKKEAKVPTNAPDKKRAS